MNSIVKGHIIRLEPNNKQITYFKKACGISRFAYNWGLSEWIRQYEQDKSYRDDCLANGVEIDKDKLNNPNLYSIKKKFNSIKREQFPFVTEVTKCSPQEAIHQLGNAFKNFFKGQSKYPKFRKKSVNDRFTIDNSTFKILLRKDKPFIQIPKLGLVRMSEPLRLKGKILSGKVFTKGGYWFISVNVELNDPILPLPKTGKEVGIDLGITDFATLSDGTKIQAPKPLKKEIKKLKRLSKQLSRKQKGSKNREKAKIKLSRLHYRISNIRKDFLHKTTSYLIRNYDVICIENLNVKGMVKNKRLSRSINDLGFYEFKGQLVYKANIYGKTVKELDRFYPSSKTCSCCGYKLDKLSLNVREWECPNCHNKHDRDINASINILRNSNKVLTNHWTVGSIAN